MIALRNVLVATDFSQPSEAALRYARALAHAFTATLHVLHVVPDSMSLPWTAVSDAEMATKLQQDWEREARERLELLVSARDRSVLRVRLAVRSGDPVSRIDEYAASNAIDLIVIGTRGRGLVAHLLLGGVAERVVRTAPCPVMTVRQPQHEFVTEALEPRARVEVCA